MNYFFFIQGRFADLDTYLPVAFEIKHREKNSNVSFIFFTDRDVVYYKKNKTLYKILKKNFQLYYLKSDHFYDWHKNKKEKFFYKSRYRLKLWIFLVSKILFARKPVLFKSRLYSEGIFIFLRLISKIKGGKSFCLSPHRGNDDILYKFAKKNIKETKLDVHKKLNKFYFFNHTDGLIYFHGRQYFSFFGLYPKKRLKKIPVYCYGLPTIADSWIRKIQLQAKVVKINKTKRVFTIYSVKHHVNNYLRKKNSLENSINLIILSLLKIKNSKIFLRSHPSDWANDYLKKILKKYSKKIKITYEHPDVLNSISEKIFFHATNNITSTSYDSDIVDCTDFSKDDKKEILSHLEKLNIKYIDPSKKNFFLNFKSYLNTKIYNKNSLIEKRIKYLKTSKPNYNNFRLFIKSPRRFNTKYI